MKKSMLPLVLLLVVAMIAVAQYAGNAAIIFPEIAAIAFGAWAMEKRPWPAGNASLCLSPTLAAATGVLVLRYCPGSLFVKIVVAFILVVVQLRLLRSAVVPSLSAAILPLLLGVESWAYPASVGVLTAIIATGCRLLDAKGCGNFCAKPADRARPEALPGRARLWEAAYWGKVTLFVGLVAAVAVRVQWLFLMAPPLLVLFTEFTRHATLREKPVRIFALISLAALAGVVWLHWVTLRGGYPLWLSACCILATVFALSRALRLSLPPALAIALLPTLLPPQSLAVYPLHVAVGCAAFLLIGRCCFKPRPAAPLVR